MQYREIIAVCSQIHTKHINALCGQNVELLNVKLVVNIVTKIQKIRHTMYSVRYVVFVTAVCQLCIQLLLDIRHATRLTYARDYDIQRMTELWWTFALLRAVLRSRINQGSSRKYDRQCNLI